MNESWAPVLRPLWWCLVVSEVVVTERSGFTRLRCGIPFHCISEILQAWPLLKTLEDFSV